MIWQEIPPEGYYVYLLLDQGVPFYVGMGIRHRAFDHARPAARSKECNPYKKRKIDKIISEGREIEYRFVACGNQADASILEANLIDLFGRKSTDRNGLLSNLAPGGFGGRTMNDEGYRRSGLKHKARWNSLTEEQIQEINDRIKSTKLKNGTWKKPSAWTLSEDNISRMKRFNDQRKRRVEQLNDDGTVVTIYESTLDAANRSGLQTSQGSISNACNGRQQKAGGYRWRYSD